MRLLLGTSGVAGRDKDSCVCVGLNEDALEGAGELLDGVPGPADMDAQTRMSCWKCSRGIVICCGGVERPALGAGVPVREGSARPLKSH